MALAGTVPAKPQGSPPVRLNSPARAIPSKPIKRMVGRPRAEASAAVLDMFPHRPAKYSRRVQRQGKSTSESNPWYPYAQGEPPPQVSRDRDKRLDLAHASIVSANQGDPLPGYSALDHKRDTGRDRIYGHRNVVTLPKLTVKD